MQTVRMRFDGRVCVCVWDGADRLLSPIRAKLQGSSVIESRRDRERESGRVSGYVSI